jgi:hypothetical protein
MRATKFGRSPICWRRISPRPDTSEISVPAKSVRDFLAGRLVFRRQSRCSYPQFTLNSVQSGSQLAIRFHRLDLHVVLRKLIPKLKAFSQRIYETSMVRFYSSVNPDDKMLIRQMNGGSVSHRNPHRFAAAIERKPTAAAAFPTEYSIVIFVLKISSF